MKHLMRRWRRTAVPYGITGVAALALATGIVLASPGDQITPPGPILPANGCSEGYGVGRIGNKHNV